MNKFKTEEDIGPLAPWILLCGPSCIGKSYFASVHNFYKLTRGLSLSVSCNYSDFKNIPISAWKYPKLYHKMVVTATDYKLWPDGWYTKEYKLKKRAILLGAPFFLWKERILKRGGSSIPDYTIEKWNLKYKNWIKELKKYNIPYIFVENRNNYPILDESSFFTMITSNE